MPTENRNKNSLMLQPIKGNLYNALLAGALFQQNIPHQPAQAVYAPFPGVMGV